MKFVIHYADGSEYEGNSQAEWDAAPLLNIQIIEEWRPDGSKLVHMGQHFYMMRGGAVEDGLIVSCNESQLWKYLLEYCPWMKHARWISDKNFRVVHDKVFPPQTIEMVRRNMKK